MASPADLAPNNRTLADRTIDALTDEHATVGAVVRGFSDDQLAEPSAAEEWTVAQVLSHLGSGAEITLAALQAALGERSAPGDDFNPSVWDRWNALSPDAQRAGFLEHDAALVAALAALDPQQRDTLQVRVGFAPAPLTVAAFAGLRLHEAAQHGWDVRAALDPNAGLAPDTAQVLAELFAGEIAFLLGFIAKPKAGADPVRLDIAGSGYVLSIADSVTLSRSVTDPTAIFQGPLEAAIRLLAGRLGPSRTSSDLTVTGNVTLGQLRDTFPGF